MTVILTSQLQRSPGFHIMGTFAMERKDHPKGICDPPMQRSCREWTRYLTLKFTRTVGWLIWSRFAGPSCARTQRLTFCCCRRTRDGPSLRSASMAKRHLVDTSVVIRVSCSISGLAGSMVVVRRGKPYRLVAQLCATAVPWDKKLTGLWHVQNSQIHVLGSSLRTGGQKGPTAGGRGWGLGRPSTRYRTARLPRP